MTSPLRKKIDPTTNFGGNVQGYLKMVNDLSELSRLKEQRNGLFSISS